jgi:polar amino acid transport system substrate-binding protein
MRFASGGTGIVHYVCGSQEGWERESIDVLGGSRSARLIGFRELKLRGGDTDKRAVRVQPDAGQKAMLEAMMAQFRRSAGAEDYTESFVLSAQALLAVKRSLAERRVVTIETRFPFAIG